jgi:hypothetical protein
MSNPECYTQFVSNWPTNEGGALINDPRKAWKLIPELECEEFRIGSFPDRVADVCPDQMLSTSDIVTLWDGQQIALARMHLYGVTKTLVHKSKAKWSAEMKKAGKVALTSGELYTWRSFLHTEMRICTRDALEQHLESVQDERTAVFRGKPLRLTGCVVSVHARRKEA